MENVKHHKNLVLDTKIYNSFNDLNKILNDYHCICMLKLRRMQKFTFSDYQFINN